MQKATKNVDWGLRFFRDVLGLEHLHFGYWRPGAPATLDALREAQDAYMQRLLDAIPEGVVRVLDVGAGTGEIARELTRRGYCVESVSPDGYQEEVFRRKCPFVPFHRKRFEDLDLGRQFDLVLMAESCQYLDLDAAVENCRRLLRPGGYVLVADYFRREEVPYYRTTHVWDDFARAVERNGFRTAQEEDVTERTLPTLEVARDLYGRYALPSADIVTGYFANRHRFVTGIARRLFARPLKKLRTYMHEHNRTKLDPEKFRRLVAYKFVLLQNGPARRRRARCVPSHRRVRPRPLPPRLCAKSAPRGDNAAAWGCNPWTSRRTARTVCTWPPTSRTTS
jgi:SAM-dependent methyltransferase